MDLVVPRNRELDDLLSRAPSIELNVLADLITDLGKGRAALDANIKQKILKHRKSGSLREIPDILAREICEFGGNSLANTWRRSGLPYREIAIEATEKLGGKPGKDLDLFDIESTAIDQVMLQQDHSSPTNEIDVVKALTPIIRSLANESGTAKGLLAGGGSTGLNATTGIRLATSIFLPFSIVAATQVAAPAYRITIPAVLQIAKIRRIQFNSDLAAYREALLACK